MSLEDYEDVAQFAPTVVCDASHFTLAVLTNVTVAPVSCEVHSSLVPA